MQFGTRSMLVATTACGIWLGWRVNEVRHEREALAIVQSLGGKAFFDYQCNFDEPRFTIHPHQKPTGNSWLRKAFGDEYFRHIASLDFRGTNLTDKDLKQIAGLSGLLMLDLAETQVTDAGLARLARMRQLRGLDLSRTQVTSTGLVHLAGINAHRSYGCRSNPPAGTYEAKAPQPDWHQGHSRRLETVAPSATEGRHLSVLIFAACGLLTRSKSRLTPMQETQDAAV